MLALAYWNVNHGKGKGISQAIIDLATAICTNPIFSGANGEVLLCLSEPGNISFAPILAALQATGKNWWMNTSPSGRFVTFGTVPHPNWQPAIAEVKGSLPGTLTRMQGGLPLNFEVWFVHLVAPINVWSPASISTAAARDLRLDVEAREIQEGHARTVVIGDFNMEPFSEAMVSPAGLNAASCKTLASTGYKSLGKAGTVQYFYNPMWELLGTFSGTRQPGSFLQRDNSTAVHWHLIDHVLVRPPLISSIHAGTPVILANAGATKLTTAKGGIRSISDHLPVLVTLNI